MQDAMAVFTCQPINQGALTSLHSSYVNKTPISLVEVECFLTGDRVMWIAVPCDQSELGELPNDDGVGGSYGRMMPHVPSIFKQRDKTCIRQRTPGS